MRVKIKGINKVKKRLASGEVRTFYYHRATGSRLPGKPGESEFMAAFAKANEVTPKDTGTIAALIRTYLLSLKFEKKRPATQREYKRMATHLENEFGTMPIRLLRNPRVRGVFLAYHEKIGRDRPREADNRLSVLSAIFSYAATRGDITENPIKGFERLYDNDRSDKIWLEKDISGFMMAAPLELQQALILALHTGQRYGDLVRLRWSDYDGEVIMLRQSKGNYKRTVAVTVTAALKLMLDRMDRRGPFILTRSDGRPWFTEKDDKALGKAWGAHMKVSGLYHKPWDEMSRAEKQDQLHYNDLRGTAVTMLAEAGATVPEIASITGHTMKSVHTILEKYMARTPALSKAAIIKFENAPATKFANQLQTTNAKGSA